MNERAVTAIDILLEPDATMTSRAEAENAQLLEAFPEGFTLDASHRPHVTVVQRYVYTDDLGRLYAAVSAVLVGKPIETYRLEATGYYYLSWGALGVAGIVVEPTPDLLGLQQELLDAIITFTAEQGSAEAFVVTDVDPEINQPTIDYVAKFVPFGSGANFNPHVTIGVAPHNHLDAMTARPFPPLSFSPAGVAAFQLGNLGTASLRLHTFA